MSSPILQHLYPEEFSHCFGCGRLNKEGTQLQSHYLADKNLTLAKVIPDTKYTGGVPNHLYGGIIASLLDCHGAASAAAFKSLEEGKKLDGSEPIARCVTGTLSVRYIKPTPLNVELHITGKLISIENRKITVGLSLTANGEECATGEMLAIQLKD